MTSCGDDPIPTRRVRVTMPSGLASAVKARVGPRGFAAYVNAAVARQLRCDALEEELLEGKDTEVGSTSAGPQTGV